MTHPHTIRCTCGVLTGTLDPAAWSNRVLCYCKDCQAFAEQLGREDEILDTRGGSDIVQTAPRFVSFTQGHEHLACLRLTPDGLLRWYAACCNTPIGNTPANHRFSFVGLLHSCLGDGAVLDGAFGPPRMQVFTQFAKGEPKPKQRLLVPGLAGFVAHLAAARLGSGHRKTPFFDESGQPVAVPTVLVRAPTGKESP